MFLPQSTHDRINYKRLYRATAHGECFMLTFLSCIRGKTFVEFQLIWLLNTLPEHILYEQKFYIHLGDFLMAQKFDWNFVEIKLLASDKPKLLAWFETQSTGGLELIDDMTELGYKVSISYIDDQNSYVVSVSGTDRSGINNKQTVTSWSSNLEECVAIAGYKVLHLAKDKDWKDCETDNSNWG